MKGMKIRSGTILEIIQLDETKKYLLDENVSPRMATSKNIMHVRDYYKTVGLKISSGVSDITLLDIATKNGLTIITRDKGLCWLASSSNIEIVFYDRKKKKFYLNSNEKRLLEIEKE